MLQTSVLFIEGTSDSSNGDLRRGYRKLIGQAAVRTMPRIVMGGNKPETIRKFLKHTFPAQGLLLIDLDAPEAALEHQLAELGLQDQRHFAFFMIQEMEAWFLSQPGILADYYQDPGIASRMTRRPPREVPDPKAEMQHLTRKHPAKGAYHAVRDGTELLARLNLAQLRQDFPQVDRLIQALAAIA
ncbi:MAG: DUF4276 family protein [Bacteroidia bacterium]|nr:DUF4276 family protein [Bacteroidia bacterium]